jgi:glycosyltransferase involved in cell wall biosynthesis
MLPLVGIELRAAARPTAGGIVAVLVGTLHELFRLRADIDFVMFCTVFNRELAPIDAPNVEAVTLPLDDYFSDLGRAARARELDVLFRGYPTLENPDFPLDRQIFLIPDLQHEYHPEFFDSHARVSRRIAFRTALNGAGAIMTISEFARRTIEERASSRRDVFVARPGLPPEFVAAQSEDATAEERETVPTVPFFLLPANLWPHKNHEGLFEAFRHFRDRTSSPAELVLTGSPTGWPELRARHPDLPVRHLGYVSAPHLRLLYERALALAFFSRFEGFGIPLLEAFASGTPVLCSNTTSLPEVAGDAALTCDPEDVDAISRLLEQVAADPELRAELVARGRRRVGDFTWDKAAERVGDAIQRVHVRAASSRRHSRIPTAWNRASLRRELGWRLIRMPRLLTLVLRGRAFVARLRRRNINIGTAAPARLRVTGFWPDNYLGERLEVVIDARDRPRELRISGHALLKTTLVVTADGKRLGQFELMQGERVSPRVELPRGPRKVVIFSFSDHSIDDEGRSVTFLLEETNAFREEDFYSLG